MNKIIEEILKEGISVLMEHNIEFDRTEYIIHGFYKSGTVKLIECEDAALQAIARYDQKTYVNSVRDIVELNYDWWQKSKDRFDGWKEPDPFWIKLLLKYDFIKEERTTKIYSTI